MKIKSYKRNGKTFYKFNAYLGKDPLTGKDIRTNRQGFRTKKEAEIAYLELREGKEKPVSNLTYGEVYSEWLELYRCTVKESTLKKTMGLFKNHILPIFGSAKIEKIGTRHVQKFALDMSKIMKDYKRAINYLSLVFDYALKQKIIEENPCTNIIYPEKKSIKENEKKKAWTREELQHFFEILDELPLMWQAYFRLIAMTGMRRGEALALEWKDIKGSEITINKTRAAGMDGEILQSAKTFASNRSIPVDKETLKILKEWRALQTKLFGFNKIIFTNKPDGSYITLTYPLKVLNRLLARHPELPRITIHGLRHTHTSLLIQAGVPLDQVMDRLGHDDVKTTLNIYNHVTKEEQSQALDKFIGLVVTKT